MLRPNDPFFVSLLADRIDYLRETFEIDPDFQIKGFRFANTLFACETIEGMIMVRKNTQLKGMIPAEIMGLDFDPDQILDGKFDAIIRLMLKQMAAMDYEGENRIDFN